MNTHKLITVFVACVWLLPTAVSAETVLRTGDSVAITNDRGVVGDFYGAGNVVTVSGVIEGDFVSLSGRTTLNGQVSGDVLAAGASVDVHGPVGDDVRVLAGEAIVADVVAGDVVVLGGSVNILSTATVTGDVIMYAGQAEISGAVEGNVYGSVGELRINAPVGGAVDVRTRQLSLGDEAAIAGTVSYQSENLVDRSPNAVVSGELLRNDSIYGADDERNPLRTYALIGLALLFSVLLWQLLSRRTLHQVANNALQYSPRPLLFGFLTLLVTPLVIIILFTSMLGSLVGLVLLVSYLLVLLLSLVAMIAVVGLAVFKALNQVDKRTTVGQLLVGVVVLLLLTQIPVIGALLITAAFLVTFGALLDETRQFLQK